MPRHAPKNSEEKCSGKNYEECWPETPHRGGGKKGANLGGDGSRLLLLFLLPRRADLTPPGGHSMKRPFHARCQGIPPRFPERNASSFLTGVSEPCFFLEPPRVGISMKITRVQTLGNPVTCFGLGVSPAASHLRTRRLPVPRRRWRGKKARCPSPVLRRRWW